MNVLSENTEYCIDTFTEIVYKLSSSIMNVIFNTFGVSSEIVDIVKPNNDLFFVIMEYYRGLINLLCFDTFQFELLKIFLTILFVILLMIYIAWYFYGPRVSDRFMSPDKNTVTSNIVSKRKSSKGDT